MRFPAQVLLVATAIFLPSASQAGFTGSLAVGPGVNFSGGLSDIGIPTVQVTSAVWSGTFGYGLDLPLLGKDSVTFEVGAAVPFPTVELHPEELNVPDSIKTQLSLIDDLQFRFLVTLNPQISPIYGRIYLNLSGLSWSSQFSELADWRRFPFGGAVGFKPLILIPPLHAIVSNLFDFMIEIGLTSFTKEDRFFILATEARAGVILKL